MDDYMQSFDNIGFRSVLQQLLCLASLALLCWNPGFSQDGPQDYRESLYLQTDRDLYIVGEQVWMKVYKMDAHGNKPDNFSKVVYIELLNQAGYPVHQLKLHVPDKSESAGFTLSDTLSSGNYLLRAYTSWMKNYPAEDFAFRTISIINPFRSIESIGVQRSMPVADDRDSCAMIRTDMGLLLELKFDTTSYGTREQVKVNIQAKDSSGNPVEADLSVSIARSCMFNDHRANIPDLGHPSGREEPGSTPYLPELEGVVLSGTMLSSITEEPIDNEDIVLSIVGKAARCQVYRTNDRGEFYFNLDDSGVQELVIQPVDSAVSDYYIELEPDFHNAYDHSLPGHFYLDSSILQVLNQGIISMQVENIYKAYRDRLYTGTPDTQEIDFYGEPEFHIQMSDYISLRNMREVIKEIVPAVSIQVKNGKSSLTVENGIDNMIFDSKPLVLVDGVPFDELDQILNIRITELESIEVINLRYVLDGHLFEGIMHFVTEEGKMAGLEFDHAVFRQGYAVFSEESCFRSPIYNSDSLKSSPIPDFRNTLYWNPDLFTREDGTTGFEFYTADETGEYVVFVEGITPEGKSAFIYKKLLIQ
jgi:hypothetical protein